MNSFFRTIQRWFEQPNPPVQSPPRVQLHRQYLPPSSGSRRRAAIVVEREPRPYWQERGWRQNGQIYQGNYQTTSGSWPGHVVVSPGGRVEVYIHNPPSALKRHPHWECFRPRNGGWYFVHPVNRVADVSAGILGVEKTITEAYAL